MDGVLADFAGAFREVEKRLFGAASPVAADAPEVEARQEEAAARQDVAIETRRRRDAIWKAIHDTPDFWTTLKPHDPDAVRRIHGMMIRHGLEVFFITQRPSTVGQTVQRQTQFWLRQQGFDLPSVLVIAGSRGAAAGALRLDYLVDDSATNCLDALSDSSARPILIVEATDSPTARRARSLGIGVAGSIGNAIDLLEQTSTVSEKPRLVERLAAAVGWQ
jgi:hypothetical protein